MGSGSDLEGYSPLVLAIVDSQVVEFTIQNKKGLREIPKEVDDKQEEKEQATKSNTAQVEGEFKGVDGGVLKAVVETVITGIH